VQPAPGNADLTQENAIHVPAHQERTAGLLGRLRRHLDLLLEERPVETIDDA